MLEPCSLKGGLSLCPFEPTEEKSAATH